MIDDDEEDKELFSETLFSIDASIECVKPYDGEQALQMLVDESNPLPAFICVDLNMPLMNGFDFLKAIKKSHLLRHIPVIIFTTSSDLKQKERAINLGASSFLTKPSSLKELKNELTKMISTHMPG
jgi:CheY-like chemotaxis protein